MAGYDYLNLKIPLILAILIFMYEQFKVLAQLRLKKF